MPNPRLLVISKTDFVRYTKCPLYAWLYKNRRDLTVDQKPSKIAEQGHQVEEIAHALFAKGTEVKSNYQQGADETKQLMKNGTKIIYQATAITDKYLCRADILIRAQDGKGWKLYEVKSSTELKKEHIPDISFQLEAFTKAGILIIETNIILVNSDYIYSEKKGLEPEKFLTITNLTEKITQALPDLRPQI